MEIRLKLAAAAYQYAKKCAKYDISNLHHTISRVNQVGKLATCAALISLGLGLSTASGEVQAANNSADPNKVLKVAFPAGDNGFDLNKTANQYSTWVGSAIFETLLTYDYLARPAKLVAKTAEQVPEPEAGGTIYTVKLKKGIYFAPDPAFKGQRRELTAADYAYTFKRSQDPTLRSPIANFLEGKLVGLPELVEQAKKTGKFDYDAPIEGLQVVDRYTLRFKLIAQDYNFLFVLAYTGFGAVAREVVETYGADLPLHPVGTGPYMLKQYVSNSKIVLVTNPEFKEFIWDFADSGDPRDKKVIAEMKGKKMPQIGRVEVNIMEEEQPRWLAFLDKQLDFDMLPQSASPSVLDGDKLKPKYKDLGIDLMRVVDPEITYSMLNYTDPVIGGSSKEKIALRRALVMAYSAEEEIQKVRLGQAVRAQQIVPPGILGHDPKYRSSISYNIKLGNQLLDHFGYKRGADGMRTLPDGKPLVIKIRGETSSTSKIFAEIWKRGLDQLGIKAQYTFSSFADNMKEATECKLAIWGSAWGADLPDGENFLQLLYGPNSQRGNHTCYRSDAFDALYKKAVAMPHGPERYALYQQMNRQMEADSVWALNTSRIRNWIIRPWVKGFKKHPIVHGNWELMDLEKH